MATVTPAVQAAAEKLGPTAQTITQAVLTQQGAHDAIGAAQNAVATTAAQFGVPEVAGAAAEVGRQLREGGPASEIAAHAAERVSFVPSTLHIHQWNIHAGLPPIISVTSALSRY